MLLDSFEHAEEDIQPRQLREQQVEAERILLDARKQLARARRPSPGPRSGASSRRRWPGCASWRQAARTPGALKDAIHALDEASRPFVERVMNRAIRERWSPGHSVEEY